MNMINFAGNFPNSQILQILEGENSLILLYVDGIHSTLLDNVSNIISYDV